jgi:hypothetical protein
MQQTAYALFCALLMLCLRALLSRPPQRCARPPRHAMLDYIWEPYIPYRSQRLGDLPSSSLLQALNLQPLVHLPPNRSVFGIAVDKGTLELEWYVYYANAVTRQQLEQVHPLTRSVPLDPADIYLYSFTDFAAIDVYTTDISCGHRAAITGAFQGYPMCMQCKRAQYFRWDGRSLTRRNSYVTTPRPHVPDWFSSIPSYLRGYQKHAIFSEKPDGRTGYYVAHVSTDALIQFLDAMPMPRALLEYVKAHKHQLDYLKWDVGWNVTQGVIDKAAVYGII